MLSTDNVYQLINYTSFVESLFIAISVAGLLYLRVKQPNRERPIKVSTSTYQYLCHNNTITILGQYFASYHIFIGLHIFGSASNN